MGDDGRVTVELVAIGSELLLGQIVDSNSAWLAQRLAEVAPICSARPPWATTGSAWSRCSAPP